MKKAMILVSCLVIVLGTILFMKDNTILAANIRDTFVEGDFTYEVTDLGDTTTNGKVEIKDYDETASTTDLTISETIDYDGKTFDIVGANIQAFDNASKVKVLKLSKNFVNFKAEGMPFIAMERLSLDIKSSLETIIVDENNPTLKLIDGVLYNMTSGKEYPVLYPFNSSKTEYIIPEFLKNSTELHVMDYIPMLTMYAFHLESIEMPFESKDGIFTENGMLCRWKNQNDHAQGMHVYMIPRAMKRVVLTDNLDIYDSTYSYLNYAMEFVVEGESKYQSKDGCLYEGNTLVLYPGGRTDTIYTIPKGTETIGSNMFTIYANQNLKSLIIPSSVRGITRYGLNSKTLKSIKIEGNDNNITWIAENFQDLTRGDVFRHIYVDNGNTANKIAIQAVAPHLTDAYFHELGAVPTAGITGTKTSIQNDKEVQITWDSSESTNYEVRRYNTKSKTEGYKIVASTTGTSFTDTTTTYSTSYQYEVVPYSLPVTSSNDLQDPLHNYRTYGTPSNKASITTPVQKFKGTYTYKQADGKETTIEKAIDENTSAMQGAPSIPKINGYRFDKWNTNLMNPEKVNMDFTANASYVKTYTYEYLDEDGNLLFGETVDMGTDISKKIPIAPIRDGYTFDYWEYLITDIKFNSLNKDFTAKAVYKLNTNTPDDKPIIKPDDSVQTGDQLNILIPSILLIMTGLVLMVLIKKHQDIT